MKFKLSILGILFLALAAYIIYLDRDGWGWCIFGALMVGSDFTASFKDKKDKDD